MKIDQLGLQIGDPVTICLLEDESKDYAVELIRILDNAYLILSTPKSEGTELSMILREDQPLDVILKSHRYQVKFRSLIKEKRLTPIPHIHVSLSKNIDSIEENISEPVDTHKNVTVMNDSASLSTNALLTKISKTQAVFISDKAIAEVAQALTLTLSFSFADQNNVIVLEGHISQIEETQQHSFEYTMHYDELDLTDKLLIHGFIYEELLKSIHIL